MHERNVALKAKQINLQEFFFQIISKRERKERGKEIVI
jgi:hypothetical protein